MARQKFTLANLNVSQMKGALGQIQSTLNGLHLPQNMTRGLTNTLSNLEKELRNFEVTAGKDLQQKSNFNALQRIAEKISSLFADIKIQARDLGLHNDLDKFFPKEVVNNITKANNALNDYKQTLKQITTAQNREQSKLRGAVAKQTVAQSDLEAAKEQLRIQQELQKINLTNIFKAAKITPKDIFNPQEIEQAIAKIKELQEKAQNVQNNIGPNGKTYNYADNTKAKYAKQYAELEQLISAYQQMPAAIQNAENALDKAQSAYDKATETVRKYREQIKLLEQDNSTKSNEALQKLWDDISKLNGIDISKYGRTLEEAKRALSDYEQTAGKNVQDALNSLNNVINQNSHAYDENAEAVRRDTDRYREFDTQARDIEGLKSRIQYFFGLNNAINLVKRTMREAFNTIKELDKAMTETAVVTDFSVGDMWAQLPDYTKRANELGVTTKAAYEAATLYYQQGLKTNEVMAISNETLKMARIAGLDAAVATDRMTNAIRGFNMEINTTNAQRIDDVYSRLAAISASNVDEISTAMTKVASLAHSANMEFETTAAFLAQIIETTRESAETAGTALKTVVARFSEVKKLVSEGELSGADEEGELIDVNKVSSALRVAGIDLNKYFLGQVELDDIFMELASKWNQLTTLQQRYIATQAAGSRQQSRFIALMSDYARTQELVGEAYNANGAAAKQFAKTQESLESKLARLKNAWNEFAMGILNSDLVKVGVDLLTNILNGINALTSGFGLLDKGIGGVINSISKLILLFGSLGAMKTLLGGLGTSITNIGLTAAGKAPLDIAKAMSTAAVGANATGAMAGLAGKGAGGALLAGFLNPFAGIGKTVGAAGKYGWSLAKGLGGAMGIGTAGAKGSAGFMSGVFSTGGAGAAAGIAGIATALTVVTVAAGVAYVAIKKLYDASPAGQIKIAEKYADSLNEVADAARSSQREFESIQEEYNRLEMNVQQATTAEEKTAAIKSRTEYIQSLLEQNAAYAQYIDQYQVKNGEIYLTLDSDKLAEACKKIAETATRVQSGADIANANVAFQQYQKAQENVTTLEKKKKEAEADRDNPNSYEQTEEGRQQWRKDWHIDELEADLVSAQSRMLAFQKEYESFANLGISKYLTGIEETTSGKKLTDESRTFAAAASKYSFNGDNIQKRITEETTRFFGLISKETLGTLKGAQDAFIKQFETSIIPEDLKNDEKGLINAVAFDKAIESVLGPVSDNLTEGFLELDREYQNILLDLMNTGGENLSETTIKSIKETGGLSIAFKKIWDLLDVILQTELEKSFSGISQLDTARDIVAKTFKTGSKEYVDIVYKYLDSLINGFDLSNKQTEAVSKVFTDFAKDNYSALGGPDGFNTFLNNLFTSIFNTKDPELISNFFDALATLDTNSASNINAFFDLLDGLGIDFHNVEGSAEAAADKLKELANVKDPFNAEELSAKVSDAISTIWDIRERKPTQQGYRTFSEGEYKIIEDAVKALGSEIDINLDDIFKRTSIKNKEWNYVGGDLEELVQLLVQDLNNAIQQAEDYISAPEWLQKYSDFATKETITIEDNGETQKFTLEEALHGIISNPDFIEKLQNQNPEQFESIVQLLRDMGYTWSETLTKESLIEIISEALTNYDQFLANKETQPKIDRAVQSVDYLTPINELHQRPGMDFDRYQSAVEGKFAVDEHAEDKYEDILKSIKGLSAAYKQLKLDEKEQEITAKALAVNWSQQAAKLTELTEVLDKNDKILYEGSKNSYEYSGAIHAVSEAMRAAYGEQVTDEFVQAHIQQIVMARESEEAYQELLNLLQQDFFSNAIKDGNEFQQQLYALQQEMLNCGAVASQLDGMELNGVAILDGTPWMDVIAKLWGNLDAFEAYLATCNWTLVLSEEKDPATGLPLHASLVRNQPTGYGGYQPYTGSNWGRGSSGGSSGSSATKPTKEEWRSDFDWLYNLMEDIAELQREQTKLQEEQNKILELGNDSDTGKDLYENLIKQMANLLTQKTYQSSVAGYRRQEMQEFMAANAQYGGYFRFNDQDQTLEINWDAINNIGDKETYEKVKDLVSEAEAIQKKMDESDDAVRDIEAQIRQLEDIWREQYVDFEKRVLDALVKSYQRVIDNYSDLHDTVTKANDDILNALQEEIALERQIRDNTKTEDEISNTEARLAFLRRDTTGGNQIAILKAQKELEEARQSYEDTLVDQSISRLQDDNAKAAEQREKQIELMQTQLDYAAQNGEFNNDIQELISDALGADGELLTNSDLFNLLQQEESWAAMSATNRELWEDELNNTFKEVSAYLLKEQGEIDGSYLQAVASQINDGVWASASIVGNSLEVGLGSMGQSIGWAIGSMSQAIDHIVYSFNDAIGALSNAASSQQNQNAWWEQEPYSEPEEPVYSLKTYEGGSGYTVTRDGKPIVTDHQGGSYYEVLEDLKKLRGYKTGGLTTKTGPAWLDGTPSEPEYVLNARQTDAFLKLAEVLPSMFNGTSATTNNIGGNMYLEFHVNIDSISNDYDVDQLVERVKDDIYSAASYRNANVINFSR